MAIDAEMHDVSLSYGAEVALSDGECPDLSQIDNLSEESPF